MAGESFGGRIHPMEPKSIQFVEPTSRAFEKMKDILFRPFSLQKWFVLGFSAWLATLGEGGTSSGGGGGGDSSSFEGGEDSSGSDAFSEASNWVMENLAIIFAIGAVVLLLILVIGGVLLWVQSRGKFMFFDNVVHDRTLIAEPWKEFRSLANSLFLWKLFYIVLVVTIILALVGGAIFLLWPTIQGGAFDNSLVPPLVVLGALVLVVSIAAGYINMLLENFVIPIMHRDRMPISPAWGRFLSLHKSRLGSFIGFFFWTILIGIASAIAIFLLVIVTCCIAAIPLIIPYLGTVLLLPLYVFLRLLGPEFLKQFGDEFDTLSIEEKTPPALN